MNNWCQIGLHGVSFQFADKLLPVTTNIRVTVAAMIRSGTGPFSHPLLIAYGTSRPRSVICKKCFGERFKRFPLPRNQGDEYRQDRACFRNHLTSHFIFVQTLVIAKTKKLQRPCIAGAPERSPVRISESGLVPVPRESMRLPVEVRDAILDDRNFHFGVVCVALGGLGAAIPQIPEVARILNPACLRQHHDSLVFPDDFPDIIERGASNEDLVAYTLSPTLNPKLRSLVSIFIPFLDCWCEGGSDVIAMPLRNSPGVGVSPRRAAGAATRPSR